MAASKSTSLMTSPAAGAAAAAAVGAVLWAIYHRRVHRRLAALADEAKVAREQRQAERAGRIAAERANRQVVTKAAAESGLTVKPIGTVLSIYKDRRGTPRQGLLVPDGLGILQLEHWVPGESLDGLAAFSHVWVVFVFHSNTNAAKVSGPGHGHWHAKIAPPVLGGKRVGVFSTRTPHRPNPIGLSLVKLESVDIENRRLVISGLDLVDGTPVLDIKPFVAAVDSDPKAVTPDWVAENLPFRLPVTFTAAANEQFLSLAPCSKIYPATEEGINRLRAAIHQILSLDIRSTHRGRGTINAAEVQYMANIDVFTLHFVTSLGHITVTNITLTPKSAEATDDPDFTCDE